MTQALRKILTGWRRYKSEQHGAAAAEFALVLTLLTIPILNVVDFAIYAWDRMQTDNAAQIAVQAAWATCSSSSNLPATPNSYANCPNMPAAVTAAARSTSLGSSVTVASTVENYRCITTAGTLVTVGTFPGTKPANCGSPIAGSANDKPGDYIQITVNYTYTPIFPGVSIVSSLPAISRVAWMRLG